jgi:phospholipid-translocating ATPase
MLQSYVYGNDHFLFRSAAFWFSWPFVVIIALLPRYLSRVIKQTYFPNDMDTLKWLQYVG